jgi:biotin-(acetyl-CoA carboxylase) ligase
VNEKKIAGILIESSDNGWFLIGIGVNLAHAPPIPTSGPNYGRRSTSVSEFCAVTDWEKEARELAVELANDLHSFLENLHSSPTTIIEEWKRWVDSDMELVMRDTPKRERVKMVDMLLDGRIQVIGQDDGIQRTLVSDYFV